MLLAQLPNLIAHIQLCPKYAATKTASKPRPANQHQKTNSLHQPQHLLGKLFWLFMLGVYPRSLLVLLLVLALVGLLHTLHFNSILSHQLFHFIFRGSPTFHSI